MSQFEYVPMQLQTSAILENSSAQRPSFKAVVKRRFRGKDSFEIFFFKQGLLFLHTPNTEFESRKPGNGALIGAVIGGAIGGIVGAVIDSATTESTISKGLYDNMAIKTDEELLAIASRRKPSFVVEYEDMKSVVFDPPSSWSSGKFAGHGLMKARGYGKIKLDIPQGLEMMTAIQAFEKRLQDRVTVRAAWDQQNLRYVPKR